MASKPGCAFREDDLLRIASALTPVRTDEPYAPRQRWAVTLDGAHWQEGSSLESVLTALPAQAGVAGVRISLELAFLLPHGAGAGREVQSVFAPVSTMYANRDGVEITVQSDVLGEIEAARIRHAVNAILGSCPRARGDAIVQWDRDATWHQQFMAALTDAATLGRLTQAAVVGAVGFLLGALAPDRWTDWLPWG